MTVNSAFPDIRTTAEDRRMPGIASSRGVEANWLPLLRRRRGVVDPYSGRDRKRKK